MTSVLDASAWLGMVTGQVAVDELPEGPLLVPGHFDAEVLSGLRGLTRGGHLTADDGQRWWEALVAAPLTRFPVADLPACWPLSDAVSAYDAPYVALARRERAALVTADARLARGAAKLCDVRLIGRPA